MIRLNSQLLYRNLTLIRHILGLKRNSACPATLSSHGSTTTISMQLAECSVACELDVCNPVMSASLPLSAWLSCKSSARHELAVIQQGSAVSIRCWNGGEWTESQLLAARPLPSPPSADLWLDNSGEVGKSLYQLAQVTDDQSRRYCLSGLRLRGCDGQIAATDGRIACIHEGFAFPLEEALIPAQHLRQMSLLNQCSSIEIGKSAYWLHLRMFTGAMRWRIDLLLNTSGRFPNIEQCFPQEREGRTIVRIADEDAQFILRELPQLTASEPSVPVTLIAAGNGGNQQLAIRLRVAAVTTNDSRVLEMQLPNSTFAGLPRQAAFCARSLQILVEQGHREIHLPSYPAPAFCESSNRRIVFTVLPVDFMIAGAANCEVITSRKHLARAS